MESERRCSSIFPIHPKHLHRCMQFYEDGDSKSFAAVENTHDININKVVKFECVGHIQKRMGTTRR